MDASTSMKSFLLQRKKELEKKVFCKCGKKKEFWRSVVIECFEYGDHRLSWDIRYNNHQEGNVASSIADLAVYDFIEELLKLEE